MTEMEIHDKEEENEVEAVDPMEKIIEKVADNSDALLTLLDILERISNNLYNFVISGQKMIIRVQTEVFT
jgi:hypothetical protein